MPQKKTNKSGKNAKCNRGLSGGGVTRELLFKEDEQEYAEVLRPFGCNRFSLRCFDGLDRQGLIRGRMNKKCFIRTGDIVLVSVRPFEDKIADIIHKFGDDEVRSLRALRELPESRSCEGGANPQNRHDRDDGDVLFGDADEDTLEVM
jgi:translation initiation factor 1A